MLCAYLGFLHPEGRGDPCGTGGLDDVDVAGPLSGLLVKWRCEMDGSQRTWWKRALFHVRRCKVRVLI